MPDLGKDKQKLYKWLFNAARYGTNEMWRGDYERIKEVRDMRCLELYGRHYTDLDDAEIKNVIASFSGHASKHSTKVVASKNQIKMLRFYALACAIHYCDFTKIKIWAKGEPAEYTGENLRKWITQEFEANKGKLPNQVYAMLHKSWINPKSHKFLIDGDFRKFSKVPERMYYEYLEPQEVQCLINRFREIYQNLSYKVTLEEFMEEVWKN